METKYLDTLIESVDKIDTCEMLQEVYNDIFKFITEQLSSLQSQGETYGVLQKLLEITCSATTDNGRVFSSPSLPSIVLIPIP